MSGFGAGIVYGLSFVVYTFFYAKRHPEIQRETRKTWGERLVAIKESIWGMGVPIIILGGIYGGVFTPKNTGPSPRQRCAAKGEGPVYFCLFYAGFSAILLRYCCISGFPAVPSAR